MASFLDGLGSLASGVGGSALGGLGGSLLSSLFGGQEQTMSPYWQNAIDTLRNSQKGIEGVYNPTAQDMQYQFTQQTNQGNLNPALVQASLQGDTALKGISQGEGNLQAQQQALQSLLGIVNSGNGLSPAQLAQANQLQSQNNQQLGAANQATLQQAAQRGALNSGSTMLAQLLNNQNAAANNFQNSQDIAGQGYNNQLNAMNSLGNLASTLGQNQFGNQATIGNAQDTINNYNSKALNQITSQNQANQQQANAYNTSNAQSIGNENAAGKTAQSQYNAGLANQIFGNSLNKANAGNAAAGKTAQAESNAAQAQQDVQSGNIDNRRANSTSIGNAFTPLATGAVSAGLNAAGDALGLNKKKKQGVM